MVTPEGKIIEGRPPHGGRGLKYHFNPVSFLKASSPSPRRAWIEINKLINNTDINIVALPTEGVD